jgi:putative membrane protein
MSMNNNDYRTNPARHRHYFGWAFLALFAVLGTVAVVSWLFYRPVPPYSGPYYYWFPFGGFFAIFWIIAIFWVARWFLWGGRWGYYYPSRHWRHYDSAYLILRERYAKGEITKEQYDQMIRDLQASDRQRL